MTIQRENIATHSIVFKRIETWGFSTPQKVEEADWTVKQYTSIKRSNEGGSNHETIVLKPTSTDPAFKDIVLHADEAADLRVIGIFRP